MIDPLEPLLTRLPAPDPPPTLAAHVMARIERLPDRGAVDASVGATAGGRERLWWIPLMAGVLLVVAVAAPGWMDAEYLRGTMSARIGLRGALPMAVDGAAGGLVLLGLLIFLFGLFAPVGGERRM